MRSLGLVTYWRGWSLGHSCDNSPAFASQELVDWNAYVRFLCAMFSQKTCQKFLNLAI